MKITLTIDVPGINPESERARQILNAIEFAWDHSNTWANLGNTSPYISQWWFAVEGGETRYMPEEEPKATVDPELFLHLNRMWVSQPVILHALLLYREARLKENLSTEVVDQVRKEFDLFAKYAGTRMGLNFPKD